MSPIAEGTRYDVNSIMQYNETNPQVYLGGKANPCFRDHWISELSALDRSAVQVIYAHVPAGGPSAAADPALASLSDQGREVLRRALDIMK